MSRRPETLNLVVSCTQAKRQAPLITASRPGLNLELPVAERAAQWAEQLWEVPGEGCPARDLYLGHHWSVALDILDHGARPSVRLWVASAGYGLISVEDRIHPYGATFRCREPDSVLASVAESADWWQALAKHVRLPNGDAPRTIEQVVEEDPGSALVLVGSKTYLDALEPDFERALQRMECEDHALVVSTGVGRGSTQLDQASVRFDARLKQKVGGGMPDLNIRVARYLIRDLGFPEQGRRAVGAELEHACSALEANERFDRTPHQDRAVMQFIKKELRRDSARKKSPLLREWRDSGNACEQKRFGMLFDQVKERLDA